MRYAVGRRYAITFDDHTSGRGGLRFTVYGECASRGRKEVVLESWAYADRQLPPDDNEEPFTIIRSTIVHSCEMRPGEGQHWYGEDPSAPTPTKHRPGRQHVVGERPGLHGKIHPDGAGEPCKPGQAGQVLRGDRMETPTAPGVA